MVPRVIELMFIRVATAAHNMKHINDDIDFDEDAFVEAMREALYNTKRNVRKRKLVLPQRMVNYVAPNRGLETAATPTTSKPVTIALDHKGALTPRQTADDVADNGDELSLYEALLSVACDPDSVDQFDDLLEDFMALYTEDQARDRACAVLEKLRTAVRAADENQPVAGVVERFKQELEAIVATKLPQ